MDEKANTNQVGTAIGARLYISDGCNQYCDPHNKTRSPHNIRLVKPNRLSVTGQVNNKSKQKYQANGLSFTWWT